MGFAMAPGYEVIDSGVHSSIIAPSSVVIRDETKWREWYQRHISGPVLAGEALPEPPEVDFTRYTVVVIALGQKSTGGYRIEIGQVKPGDKTTLVYKEVGPAPDAPVPMVVTSPYLIVKIQTRKTVEIQKE